MGLLHCAAPLSGGRGQWISCNALPHCLGAVGSGPPAIHCLTAWGQWAVQLLQCTASLPGGSGQWDSCNALPHCLGGSGQWTSCTTLPHCLGAVGSATPSMHCPNARGQWAVDLLQYTASLPGGRGQWTPCNTLPHCTQAVRQCIARGVVWCGVVWCGVVYFAMIDQLSTAPPALHVCLSVWERTDVRVCTCGWVCTRVVQVAMHDSYKLLNCSGLGSSLSGTVPAAQVVGCMCASIAPKLAPSQTKNWCLNKESGPIQRWPIQETEVSQREMQFTGIGARRMSSDLNRPHGTAQLHKIIAAIHKPPPRPRQLGQKPQALGRGWWGVLKGLATKVTQKTNTRSGGRKANTGHACIKCNQRINSDGTIRSYYRVHPHAPAPPMEPEWCNHTQLRQKWKQPRFSRKTMSCFKKSRNYKMGSGVQVRENGGRAQNNVLM